MPKTEAGTKKTSRSTNGVKRASKPATKAAVRAAKAGGSVETKEKPPVKAVRVVEKEIVSKFPEMKGVRPNVVKRKVPAQHDLLELIERINGELGARLVGPKGKGVVRELYLASFEKEMKTERGTVLRRIVRVTFDGEGNILKLVSSK